MARAAMKRLAALSLAIALAGCDGVQSTLAPRGAQATALHNLLTLSLWVSGIVYTIVIGALIYAVVRVGRREPQNDARLGRALWVSAVGIVVGLTVLILGSFFADRALFETRRDEAMIVRVTGHQWWWRIEYRDPASGRWIETANELHLPLNRTTRVLLGSGDVIHSFWVPNIAGKIDMIPGRRNQLDLTPRHLGWFRGQCSEFCGAEHALMAFDVKVDTPTAFDAWLKAQAAPASPNAASRGAQVFAGPCGACHAVRGTDATGRAGPDLTHFASRRSLAAGTLAMNRGNLQGWTAQPQALKPGTTMPAVPLAPADLNAVATYLEGLR